MATVPSLAFGLASAWGARIVAAWHAWVAAERGRFAIWLPLFMAAGAVLYFSRTAEPAPWAGMAALVGGLTVGWALRRHPPLAAPLFALAALGAGFASAQFATVRAPPLMEVPTRATIVQGVVSAVEQLPQGQRITIAGPTLNGGAPQPREVRIRLRPDDPASPAAGDAVRVRAMLARPSPPAYPGAWDLQRDAFLAGTGAYGHALDPVDVLARAAPGGPARWMQGLREAIAARVTAVVPGAEGAIIVTLLTGITTGIPEPDKAAFRDSGLAHLLAIAGLHIGIVMGLTFGGVRLVLALWEYAALHWPTKAIAALAALAAGGGYMLLTGGHVPIIRGFAMACLVTLGVLTGRRALSLRGLALAMAAIVLIAPGAVVGVSFQMSFSAVLALIAGYDSLRPWLRRLHGRRSAMRRLAGHVVALALTSALAGTASAPYAAYHFGRIQLYFVAANIAAVPLTALWVMPAGLAALALMPLHLEALALVPMGWGVAALLWIGRAVAAWPDAVVAAPPIPPGGLLVFSLGLAWLGLWRTRVRLAGIPLMLAGLAGAIVVRPPDLLVSADARLIAVRTDAGAYVQRRSGAQHFTEEAWSAAWSGQPLRPLPDPGEAAVLAGGAVACDLSACRLRPRAAGPVALLLRGPPDGGACGTAAIVSAEPVRLSCPPGPTGARVPIIDRFSVWRDGAHAIWLDEHDTRVLSDRAARGERPWIPPPPGHPARPEALPEAARDQ